jgi:pimeloyl-ACP methyl ester carboxylesterase
VQTHSEYTKEGNGIPVIMLHSSMSSKEQWSRLSANLCQDFQTIAIDLYGYGKSSYPQNPSSFTLIDEADRIDTIIRQLIGEKQFHLVGHSYGGATALRLAYNQPHRIKSLSLFEPVAFHLLEKDDPALVPIFEVVKSINSCIEKLDSSKATSLFVDFWSGIGTYSGLNQTKQQYLNGFIKKVALDFQAGINEPLTLADYRNIQLPTCLISSPQSPLPTRQIVSNLERALPNCQTHRIDGGHMAPITNAYSANEIWQTFIRTF